MTRLLIPHCPACQRMTAPMKALEWITRRAVMFTGRFCAPCGLLLRLEALSD